MLEYTPIFPCRAAAQTTLSSKMFLSRYFKIFQYNQWDVSIKMFRYNQFVRASAISM
jgi:hypothetical protein